MSLPRLTPADLRAATLGADAAVETPFGVRPLVYADYTASGRQLAFVEDYLRALAPRYANAHTEDSLTGRTATHLLHAAEAAIKASVGAGPRGKVVACGQGSTAAIHKLQEILGVAVPPATWAALTAAAPDLARAVEARQPVVFVGPYEHHSNEVTWREGLCTVVEVDLDADGNVCLADLRRQLADERWAGRRLIGSFSAASNVTGVVAPVREIARILHRAGALALFDFAAAGPYVEIDMCPADDPEAHLDAVFLSPHKCLGGPGAAGVLVFHESLYPHHLPPSVGGGGTVVYVGPTGHDFVADVEARETAGTPGFFQTLRAALALQVKDAVGGGAIAAREHALVERAFARWAETGAVEILGPADPARRLGIVSFNLTIGEAGDAPLRGPDGARTLHPRFATVLLNDLFGIQSRAGCSCAGPYGHRLLGIDAVAAAGYRAAIHDGHFGLRPGWCRVGFHFAMDDAEADYVIEAVAFLAEHGARFLPLYRFDVDSGAWTHASAPTAAPPAFGLAAALAPSQALPDLAGDARREAYAAALAAARALAAELPAPDTSARLDASLADLQFFALGTA